MMISGAEYDNCKRWQHFLSSLQKSLKDYRSEKTNDVFLGSIDCFSTNLSRRLLARSGEAIAAKLPHSSIKKIKSTPAYIKYSALERSLKTEEEEKVTGSTETIYKHESTKSRGTKLKEESEDNEASDDTDGDVPDAQFSWKVKKKVVKLEEREMIDTEQISDDDATDDDATDDDATDDDESLAFFCVPGKKTVTNSSNASQDTRNEDTKFSWMAKKKVVKPSNTSQSSNNDGDDDDESFAFFSATGKKMVTSSSSASQDTSRKDLESIQSMDTPVPKINEACATLPSGVFPFLNENVKTTRPRKRNIFPKSIKKDVDIPSSEWTVKMLSDYVDFETSVGEIRFEQRVGGLPDGIEKIVSRALKQIKSVQRVIFRGNTPCPETERSDVYNLSRIRGTEADIRILLDAILIPFAEEMKLTIKTEKSYKNSNLPGCKFDYRLHYREDVVGLVEAKSRLHGNGLGPESVVQGILQLAALQTEVYGKMIKTRAKEKLNPLPFFNIISDGYQYVFVQLDHQKLLFDHQPGRTVYGDDLSVLKFHVMDSKESTRNILEQMAKLLFQTVHSMDVLDKNNGEDQDEDGDKDDEENDDEDDEEMIEIYKTDENGTIILE
ncbi:uncharacterized protein [Argopecten irradians]|uniref:uncharacterized protein n=1 Tax=Argopecten irradians TaxID=31199 RepID=UPI00371C6EE6